MRVQPRSCWSFHRPRQPGRDTGVGRDAGHLREDHRGAAQGAGAEVDEMEIIGHPVGGAVRRHGRDDHAVLERDAADGEGREHRGTGLPDPAARGEPSFDVRDVACIADLEIVVADPLAAGEKTVRELLGFEAGVTLDLLEPFHPIAGRALQLEGLDLADVLVALECGRDLVLRDLARVFREHPREGDGVLHGELRAGADTEVRRVGGVADQHDVPVVPPLAEHAVEREPRRGTAAMMGVGDQRLPVEAIGEQALTELHRLRRVHRRRCPPRASCAPASPR